MLGVIHRAVLGLGPKQISSSFRLDTDQFHPDGRWRHNRQLGSYRRGKFLDTTAKSILGLVDVYNMLPHAIIESADVHTFQAKLQGILKRLAGQGEQNWECCFHHGMPYMHTH